MKRSFALLMLGALLNSLSGEVGAIQSPPTSDEARNSNLEAIIGKMEKNNELSQEEQRTFDRELQQINDKIKNQGVKVENLSPLEQIIYSQDRLNKITPTIMDILESGLRFPWGMDLMMLEERGQKLRSGNIPKGGADLSSVVTSFQKFKENSEVKRKRYTKEKDDAIEKIKKITEETKVKLDSLGSVNFLKRPSMNEKIQQEEQAAIEPLQQIVIDNNKALKGVDEAVEATISSIMAITKLNRDIVDKLPDFTTWKEMKAHPETMPLKIDRQVLKRPRRMGMSSPLMNKAPSMEQGVQQEEANNPPPVPERPQPLWVRPGKPLDAGRG